MYNNKQLKMIVIIFFSLILVGTVGYTLLLKISIIDALYMTVITISTVGYKEVATMNLPAKIFSIIIIFWGIGIVGFTLSTMLTMIIDGKFTEIWRGRIMESRINKMTDHYIICGAGDLADVIIEQFVKEGHEYILVEEDMDLAQSAIENEQMVFHGEPTLEHTLEAVGIARAKGLLSVMAKDVDNIVTVLTARELNPSLHISALATDKGSIDKLTRVGANSTISTSEIGGRRLAALMTKPHIISFLDVITHVGEMDIDLAEIKIMPGSKLINARIKDSHIPRKTGLIILAIQKPNQDMLLNPNGDTMFELGDVLLTLGTEKQIEKLENLAGYTY